MKFPIAQNLFGNVASVVLFFGEYKRAHKEFYPLYPPHKISRKHEKNLILQKTTLNPFFHYRLSRSSKPLTKYYNNNKENTTLSQKSTLPTHSHSIFSPDQTKKSRASK
jgi:hypothetical protein